MMAARQGSSVWVREAVDALLSADEMGPLDELANVLLFVSGAMADARRRLSGQGAEAAPLMAIDDAFSRSVKLTREVRECLQTRRGRGEYASTSHAARDVVGRLQTVLPEGMRLTLECPLGPAIVAADGRELRRLIVGVLEAALAAVGESGAVSLEVGEVNASPRSAVRRAVTIDVRASARLALDDERMAASVRPLLRALGGSIDVVPADGGSVISLRLPCAC